MTPGVAAPIPAGVEMSVLDVQIVAADERNVPCPPGWSARSVLVTGDPAAQFDRDAVLAGHRDVGGRACSRPAYRAVVAAHGGRDDSVALSLRLDPGPHCGLRIKRHMANPWCGIGMRQ